MSGGSAKLELVLEAIDRASGPLDRIEKAIGRIERASGQSSRAMSGWGRQGTQVLNAMTAAATIAAGAVALVGKNVVSSAADFESALTGIQKKAGTSAEATAKIGTEIKALATSGEIAAPINDIAAAYERGAAAGLPVDQLREFALLSVKGADAFDMSAEAVGNFSAKLRTGLNMTAEDVREVLDLTNSLADAGIADESSIVEFMDRAGASLKTLGLAKEESLALGATLLNIGMPAEVASTGMGALAGKMLTVQTLGGKNRKTFEKYMGSVKGFSKAVGKDANGALLMMLDKLKKLDKTQRAEFLQAFVGAEWADEMLRLVEASDEYRRNLELANDPTRWMGSLDKSYALKLDDFWSQWQIAKNDLEMLSIDLGTLGMPVLKGALGEVRQIVQEIGENVKAFPELIDQGKLSLAIENISNAKAAFEELLGIDTSTSTVDKFFQELAAAVDGVSSTINAIAEAIKTIKEFMGGPTASELASKTRPADRELGLGPSGPKIAEGSLVDSVIDATERTYDRLTGAVPRINYDPAFAPGAPKHTADRSGTADQLAETANAGWGQWDAGLEAIERYRRGLLDLRQLLAELKPMDVDPGFIATPGENQIHNTIQLLEQLQGVEATPNLAEPLRAEGAAATAAATAIGQDITAAAGVTVTPQINTSSIDAATARVNALGSAIRAFPNASAPAATASVPIDGARARGGPVSAGGLYLVGEKGPELFSPGRGGTIHTAADTSRWLGSASQAPDAAMPRTRGEAAMRAALGSSGGSAPILVPPTGAPRLGLASTRAAEASSRHLAAGEPRERPDLFAAGAGPDAGGGTVGGGPLSIDASLHVGSVSFSSPEDKTEFETLLRRHSKTVAEVIAGETRRESRRTF